MNKTAAEWAKCSSAAIVAGSAAQAKNVMQMALDDIAAMDLRTARLEATLRDIAGGIGIASPPNAMLELGRGAFHQAFVPLLQKCARDALGGSGTTGRIEP